MRSGGLRLDSREAMLKGGKSGPALVPGDPEKSLLIQAVRQTGALKMPKGGRLTAAEIDALVEWVKAGPSGPPSRRPIQAPLRRVNPAAATTSVARFGGQAHLGHRPRRRTSLSRSSARSGRFSRCARRQPPAVRHASWREHDIDRFVLARSSKKGSRRSRAADKRDADPARDAGSDRPAADAGGNRRVRERHVARRVRQGRRSAAGVAALRRNVGTDLARRRALRRRRLPVASIRSSAATTRIRTRISIATG